MAIASFDLNLDGPPPPLAEQDTKELGALAALPDDVIDCPEIPALTGAQMEKVRILLFGQVRSELRPRCKTFIHRAAPWQ